MTPVSAGHIILTPTQPVGMATARIRTRDLLRRKPMFYPWTTATPYQINDLINYCLCEGETWVPLETTHVHRSVKKLGSYKNKIPFRIDRLKTRFLKVKEMGK
ncbi:hypothetical protein EGW08_022871 [Elysia chlorotica]|uniref:Uncharacterized protein n=1 Tax=Elysia chlorotica TaxID=188477 RepID=A0A3S0Z2J7_ELYCH|nr:hypothetical protein EGW08_022871 [Elysia chlorotica]